MYRIALLALISVACQTSECPSAASVGCEDRPSIEVPKVEIPRIPEIPKAPPKGPPPHTPPQSDDPQGDPDHPSLPDHLVELVHQTNLERGKHGLEPVKIQDQLTCAAMAHSDDMAQNRRLSHTGSDGSQSWDRIKSCGFNWERATENIAMGQRTPSQVLNSWMNSAGHRANILDPEVRFIGVAETSLYWTQVFAR